MHKSDKQFYLVREDVLPEAMKKTLDAKLLIERGKVESVADAVQAVDLSRSAFYKYRDTVFPFQTVVKQRIISLFFHIEDRSGTLSHLLSTVASSGCNVLTIHQTIPLQGRANVTLSLDTASMNVELNEMLRRLKSLEFVDKVDVLGSGA
ncbi:ACT domain-containing protein [Priestia megaterium]|uniref:ACT domain-containing protein n=1 Tax=Priestia megaterium TaxID=1404 RepID=UPI0024531C58|nr:ACT domain-containing protein [Priestia megaterium]MDH3140300.1 ACT domain-containing protein [Priestia megaterium]MED4240352.1 ACT domain-containing protein [Priestia megaterium]MED4251600.1 ACT domain-containing protein [Priestia megaterium]MED4264281.1 ACT domain-containing protein [Priestia megaterium]MED4278017.1 ACT domain-containing protein [Priestia megaterium]